MASGSYLQCERRAANSAMPNLATWMRPKDDPFFQRSFAAHPEVKICNGAGSAVPMAEMDGLLLTGGPDIAALIWDKIEQKRKG